jgi:16S rRNA pseudouridine516 synthase
LRLDKLLCDAGWGSRREVRRAVAQGRVTVDGKAVVSAGAQIDPARTVCIDGQDADYRPHDYLMLHKPAGVVSATEDPRLPTVIGLLPPRYRRRGLFPVGRLDRDTTGLLLLTNDGAFAHALMAPGRHVDKVYEVLVEGPLAEADRAAFATGLALRSGEIFAPAELAIVSSSALSLARLTLREGRHHQIKRMMAARGHEVRALKRISIARLTLDEALPPGAWRRLSDEETALLRSPSAPPPSR